MVLRLHLPTITFSVASKIPEENKFKDQRYKEPPIFEHWILFVIFYKRDFPVWPRSVEKSSLIFAPDHTVQLVVVVLPNPLAETVTINGRGLGVGREAEGTTCYIY